MKGACTGQEELVEGKAEDINLGKELRGLFCLTNACPCAKVRGCKTNVSHT